MRVLIHVYPGIQDLFSTLPPSTGPNRSLWPHRCVNVFFHVLSFFRRIASAYDPRLVRMIGSRMIRFCAEELPWAVQLLQLKLHEMQGGVADVYGQMCGETRSSLASQGRPRPFGAFRGVEVCAVEQIPGGQLVGQGQA